MPQDWSAQPEAAGPVTERRPVPAGDGFDAWPEAAGPMSEVPGQDYGSPGQIRIGPIPALMSPEQTARERLGDRDRLMPRPKQADDLGSQLTAACRHGITCPLAHGTWPARPRTGRRRSLAARTT